MQDRYIISEVMQLATCDFLSAVEEHCERNKVLPPLSIIWHHVICSRVYCCLVACCAAGWMGRVSDTTSSWPPMSVRCCWRPAEIFTSLPPLYIPSSRYTAPTTVLATVYMATKIWYLKTDGCRIDIESKISYTLNKLVFCTSCRLSMGHVRGDHQGIISDL